MNDYDIGKRIESAAKTIGLAIVVAFACFFALAVPHFNGWKPPQQIDIAVGAATEEHESQPRSPQWPKVRAAWLKEHGECAACGQTDHLNVHHVVPFAVDASKELDPTNLITLCTDGPGHMNCHLVIGHAGNYRCRNEKVREDAANMRAMLEERSCLK